MKSKIKELTTNKMIMILIVLGILIIFLGWSVAKFGPDIICNNRCDNMDMENRMSFYAQDKYYCECYNDNQHRLVIPMIKGDE